MQWESKLIFVNCHVTFSDNFENVHSVERQRLVLVGDVICCRICQYAAFLEMAHIIWLKKIFMDIRAWKGYLKWIHLFQCIIASDEEFWQVIEAIVPSKIIGYGSPKEEQTVNITSCHAAPQ